MRRLSKIFTSRLFSVVVAILVQLLVLITLLLGLSYSRILNFLLVILSYIMVVYIINRQDNPGYKIAWCVLILIVPVLGGFLYLVFGGRQVPKALRLATLKARNEGNAFFIQDQKVLTSLKDDPQKGFLDYAYLTCGLPIYQNTQVTYCPMGEVMYEHLLPELKKAKHFIFLEYFIINEGKMWDSILEILKQKVSEGVDVKLIYDDFGCATTLPNHYDSKLNEMGIETFRFNKLRPALAVQMNNRDHRKICVIDNNVGFCGGINLADEYINEIVRFGKWKDSALMLKGEAVWSLTVTFLQMYGYLKNEDNLDYLPYKLPCESYPSDSYVQPYSDSPTDQEDVGLNMHLNIINNSKRYLYISTPYLVITSEVQKALELASKRGVDVRIITPHIPDKAYVFAITRSNYKALIEKGIKIYEYTPGFIHSKTIVADEMGICGTVNTDYRSYYLHFECGVLVYKDKAIEVMRDDFVDTLKECQAITINDCLKTPLPMRLIRAVLNLFSPLL